MKLAIKYINKKIDHYTAHLIKYSYHQNICYFLVYLFNFLYLVSKF